MPERVVMYPDGPWCEADVEELLRKSDTWWNDQGDFTKLSLDRFKRTGLLKREYYLNRIILFLCRRRILLTFLFLVILKVPDTEYSGLNRGAAIWRMLVRILEQPFEIMGLISSRLRGKAKN